ncbi:MAG TPA: ribosome-associated translation inhibitor RaiA [Dehalococcoidia bacterium]|nr:ribosome-associated translation inhibitor RaiA [Dehalococcoidia bacterium]
MQLQISGKNMELSAETRRYIERKLGRLNRYLPDITESKVEVSREKTKAPEQHFVVQVTIESNGTLLRSEERGADLPTAIERAAAVMNRRIEHFKGKLYDRRKGKKSNLSIRLGPEEKPAIPQASGKVVKTKHFSLKPMAVDEALDQMEILGHDFFLFFNADTETVNLLYRRKDNNYGLIEPELG